MREFDRFLLSVVYDIPALLFVVDADSGRLVYANSRMQARLGNCVGRAFSELFRSAGGPYYFLSYDRAAHGVAAGAPPLQSEYFDDDSENWYHVSQREIEWIDGSSKLVCVLSEINEQKQLQKALSEAHASLAIKSRELEKAAKIDRLTQLYNRHHLDGIMEQEWLRFRRSATAFSVAIVDCDHFKQINDRHGHPMGDEVLVRLARLLSTGLRSTDTVGRWGGEEFMLLLPETTLAAAAEVMEKLRRQINEHDFPLPQAVSVSIGVAPTRSRAQGAGGPCRRRTVPG